MTNKELKKLKSVLQSKVDKAELEKQQLENDIEKLNIKIANSENDENGNLTDGIGGIAFTSNKNIEVRAKIDAGTMEAQLFRKEEKKVVKTMYSDYEKAYSEITAETKSSRDLICDCAEKYIIASDNNMQLEYWFQVNYFVNQVIANIPLYSENYEQHLELENILRNALLFDNTYIVDIDGFLKLCNAEKQENGKYKVYTVIVGYENLKDDKTKGFKNGDYLGEYTLNEKLFAVNLFFDKIGIYVKAIPTLESYIYFKKQKYKSLANVSLIIDSTLAGLQSMQFIRKLGIIEVKDKSFDTLDENNLNSGATFDLARWLMPEPGFEKVFEVLNQEIDKLYEILASQYGIPIQASDDRQKLSTESNLYISKNKANYSFIIRKLKHIADISGGKIKYGFDDEIKDKADELYEPITSQPNGNDNAVKDNTKTEKENKE